MTCPNCGALMAIIGVEWVCLGCGYSDDVDYDDAEDDDEDDVFVDDD